MTPLNGLVLAGGKSERMGMDKARISWHEKEQQYWLADLLSAFCDDVFISCRAEQAEEIIQTHYKVIRDQVADAGPLAGIHSAFNSVTGRSWLVVACDLPLIDACSIGYLVENRNPRKIATAFLSPADHLPEPLVAIWEFNARPLVTTALRKKQFSPRRLLAGQDIHCIGPLNPRALMNVNYPRDAENVKREQSAEKRNLITFPAR